MLILAQVLIALVEFFLINWLGRHSISSGYHHISFIQDTEEAPLFNFVFRVLAPTIFLVLCAAGLYYLHLDGLVVEFWRVTVLYFVIRWTYNLGMGRRRLLRWPVQATVATTAIALSYVVYHELLTERSVVLPSARGLTDELWIVVIIFLYHTFQQISLRSDSGGTERRRTAYIKERYHHFLHQFGETIRSAADSRQTEALAFAVLIYEDFNRPAIYRLVERWLFYPIGLARSLGPMQVPNSQLLPDAELIALGVRKLNRDFPVALAAEIRANPAYATSDVRRDPTTRAERPYAPGDEDALGFADLPDWMKRGVLRRTASMYNARSDYPDQIVGVLFTLMISFYPDLAAAAS